MTTMLAGTQPDFSIVVACFNEAGTIREFDARLQDALARLPYRFEVIYVNDGSQDDTLAIMRERLSETAIAMKIIDLAANYGQNFAQSAGVQHASGRDLLFMDCDLQTDPEALGPLIEKFHEGYDMVSGLRVRRQDPPLRRFLSRMGNYIISRVLDVQMRDLGCGLKVIRGELLSAFTISPERPINPGAIMQCLRTVAEVPIAHQARRHGRSRWTLRRTMILYQNILTNLAPVVYPFVIGGLMLLLAAFLAVLLASALFPDAIPFAHSPILPAILVTVHMILSLGLLLIVGEFSLRNRARSQQVAYVVRAVWSREPQPAPAIATTQPTQTRMS